MINPYIVMISILGLGFLVSMVWLLITLRELKQTKELLDDTKKMVEQSKENEKE